MPKVIVLGIFYWFSAIDNLLYAAVVDCTGHGLPGAFMSLIGKTLLNQIINEWRTKDPAMLLEIMHEQVRQALNQDTSNSKAHAGMDVCLVAVNRVENKAIFAVARGPLYVVQNGAVSIVKGDPRSVGGYQREEKRYFNNHSIDLSKGTSLYLTTDGYLDQMNPALKIWSAKIC
ncbi:MAG TPA: hypothetical protein ENN24_02505 [Bacteroidetes bacterium]|nr:hypothetical protein [Bacteroidota bacterium]